MRAGILIIFLAVAAYANSIGNGFAYDDQKILIENPLVTTGNWRAALHSSWWPRVVEGSGLYRPFTSASFSAEWVLSGGSPVAFHSLNVIVHALVSLLVFVLLLELGSAAGALAGAALFAVHPLHTEAVANVVGRAELYAALFYLAACIVYWRGRSWQGPRRLARFLALGILYFLALSAKEIGVTLPGALLLLEMYGSRPEAPEALPLPTRLRRESATYLLLGSVLLAYLFARLVVLGTIAGEMVAPIFQLIGPTARVLTAVAVWAQYLRLLVFPLDLVSDYDPAVLFPSEGLDLGVLLGALCLVGLAVVAARAWRRTPLVTLGILFFAGAVFPVSNFLFSTGTLLAERTLYLPSVGLSLVVAGLTEPVLALRPWLRRWVVAGAVTVALAFFVKTVDRNPAWMNTFVVIETLNDEHPESWRAFRARAQGLERVGDAAAAARNWDQAVLLAPTNYTLLVGAATFHDHLGDPGKAEAYLHRAVALLPRDANPYQHLASFLLRRGRGREGHGVAVEGLAQAGTDAELWALVSESYVLAGDLPAAVRAREAALGANPGSTKDQRRLEQLLDMMGDSSGAAGARGGARAGEGRP